MPYPVLAHAFPMPYPVLTHALAMHDSVLTSRMVEPSPLLCDARGLCRCYAMPGTETAYGPTRCGGILQETPSAVTVVTTRSWTGTSLRVCYAMSGTEIVDVVCSAMSGTALLCDVRYWNRGIHYAICGTDIWGFAMRYPVLTSGSLLCDVRY
eukprot:2368521-Rhodomonas_salina.1